MRNERYSELELAARGAESTVWKATDRLTGRLCAIKTGEKARREAKLALQLRHPYIAAPIDCGMDEELGDYATYPFYSDPSIRQFFTAEVSELERQRVAVQLAEVLCFLHTRGWYYVDFKPENFLVTAGGIMVLDLGLCRSMSDTHSQSSFSGTFPYIAPESLLGRSYDARSDIFSLGMLLLHTFFMRESWNSEPSMSALISFLDRKKMINGFWGTLLNSITAIESGQRISTAFDLWQKLLPEPAANMLLFFPFVSAAQLTQDLPDSRWISLVSPSPTLLEAAEDKLTLREWDLNRQVINFTALGSTPQHIFVTLAAVLAGRTPGSFFEAIQVLKEARLQRPVRISIRGIDQFSPKEAGLLLYGLSSLKEAPSFSFYTTSSKRMDFMQDWEMYMPSIRNPGLLKEILPGAQSTSYLPELPSNSSFPEDVLKPLCEKLPDEWDRFWPAAARNFNATMDWSKEMDPSNRKILLLLTLAGGSLQLPLLQSCLGLNAKSLATCLTRLLTRGMINQRDDTIVLQYNASFVAKSFRNADRQAWARKLAALLPVTTSWERRYALFCEARFSRPAALAALRMARAARTTRNQDDWRLWASRACRRGARLPVGMLISVARGLVNRGELAGARGILKSGRSRYGKTFRLGRLKLDLLHRAARYVEAILLCRSAANAALSRNKIRWLAYFQIRMAWTFTMQQNFEAARTILESVLSPELPPGLAGLVYHCQGLLCYFRGQIAESIEFYRKAARYPHEARPSSILNLGVAYLKQGRYSQASRALNHSFRLLQKIEDAEKLSFCYNNLGVLAKQQGRLGDAREAYEKALQLARVYENHSMILNCMLNIAVTLESEGNINQAIETYERVISEARKLNLRGQSGTAFTNLAPLYALKGEKLKAVRSIRSALRIKRELGLAADLGYTYENLALSLLFLGRYRAALSSLNQAKAIFADHNLPAAQARIRLLEMVCKLESGEAVGLPDLSNTDVFHEDSFERGLFHLIGGAVRLKDEQHPSVQARQELYEAERIFRKLPSLIWLARTLRLKSLYHVKKGNPEKAALAHAACTDILSKVGVPISTMPAEENMSDTTDFYNIMAGQLPYRVLVMIKEILSLDRPEEMISRALNAALEFSDMERAVLILQETPARLFRSASVEENAIADICDISKSALDAATQTVTPFVCLDAALNSRFQGNPSIIANRIMSIVCFPFKTSGGTSGVLYLDSREGVESLTRSETVLMEVFASIIAMILDKVIALEKSQTENIRLKEFTDKGAFPEFLGISRQILDVQRQIHKVLDSDLTVLITGETGTGKELVARVIHHRGGRRNGKFVAVNCSAFTKELLESEMFGHEKGSFTGAIQQKRGLFEQADDGTFFLDEIGEMPLDMQAKLLRVLEAREFRRVGGLQTLHTTARLVLATNQDLESMVHAGTFREDLYYRIKGIQIRVPPIRERPEDIAVLADSFLKSAKLTSKRIIRGFSPDSVELLRAYSWPGNVRQLKHEIERIVALSDSEWIEPSDFDPTILNSSKPGMNNSSESIRQIEKRAILERLRENDWNVMNAARSLGLSRHGLYSKMKRYGIPANKSEA